MCRSGGKKKKFPKFFAVFIDLTVHFGGGFRCLSCNKCILMMVNQPVSKFQYHLICTQVLLSLYPNGNCFVNSKNGVCFGTPSTQQINRPFFNVIRFYIVHVMG